MTQRIVVGIDDSPAAAAALSWAADEARLRGAELVGWSFTHPNGSGGDTAATELPGASTEDLAAGYPLELHQAQGDAAAGLIAASAAADLLVVGSRDRGRLTGLLPGSVSRMCLSQALCPVVVVHPRPEPVGSLGRVIVGLDMSHHSRRALLVAADEAALRGADLEVVHAVYWDNSGVELMVPSHAQLVAWGQELVAQELGATGVTAQRLVTHGHAAEVLVQESARADLLVLGTRGLGSLTGALLGSTSQHCVQRAHCPVMVVRPEMSGAADHRQAAAVRAERST